MDRRSAAAGLRRPLPLSLIPDVALVLHCRFQEQPWIRDVDLDWLHSGVYLVGMSRGAIDTRGVKAALGPAGGRGRGWRP
jgi:hypothetical protein